MMTPKDFQKLCKTGGLCGAYLFFGEEEYLKNHCLHLARASLFGPDEDDPFNRVVISAEGARDAGFLNALTEQLSSLPMFGEKKLIELHGVNYGKLPPADLNALLSLLREQKDSQDSLLILYAESGEFDAGELPRRPSALFRSFDAAVVTLHFAHAAPAALNAWVIRRFSASGVSCTQSCAEALIGYCSEDLSTLACETEKLICYTLAANRTQVDPRDIETVCCGKSIDGAFEFTDALMRGDGVSAQRLLSHMKAARQAPESILGGVVSTLTNMFTVKLLRDEGTSCDEIARKTGLHEMRVKRLDLAVKSKKLARIESAMKLCMDADLEIKSTALDSYTVLDRLVVRLCRV